MDRQNEPDILFAQRTEVYIDGVKLTFVDLLPLAQCASRTTSNLVFHSEDHATIVGFVQATDLCLESVTGLDAEGRIFATDQALPASCGIGQQTIPLALAVLHSG